MNIHFLGSEMFYIIVEKFGKFHEIKYFNLGNNSEKYLEYYRTISEKRNILKNCSLLLKKVIAS